MKLLNTPVPDAFKPFCATGVIMTPALFLKLRSFLIEHGELDKFIKWQEGKFIKLQA